MSLSIIQFVLAARNDEEGGWMQLLVFLVMAVLWALSGIKKAKANKIKDSDFAEEQLPEDTGPSAGPYPHPKAISQPLLKKTSRSTSKIDYSAKPHKLDLPNKTTALKPPEAEFTPQLNFEGAETLKKAILYYEVLGKPLGW